MTNEERFNNIQDIHFVPVDIADIERSFVAIAERILNVTLMPADPLRLFLASLAAMQGQLLNILDMNAKQNLLRFSTGVFLEHLGDRVQVRRLNPTNAKTTLKFSINEDRNNNSIVPIGTRVTPGNRIFFTTDELLTIPAG